MTAIFHVANRGNIAIQEEVWEIPAAELKLATEHLDMHQYSYWYFKFGKQLKKALKTGDAVKFSTSGFSSSELANVLRAVDIEILEVEK
jgi:hypothetical protein